MTAFSLLAGFSQFSSNTASAEGLSRSEKRDLPGLSPSEINKVDVTCAPFFKNEPVRANMFVECILKIPSNRSLPENTIVSIGNDYQSPKPQSCNYNSSKDTYQCDNIFTYFNTGRQNIYLKINGNTEPTGDTLNIENSEKNVLPANKITDLDIVCLTGLPNYRTQCTIKDKPTDYALPADLYLQVGDSDAYIRCTNLRCNASTGGKTGRFPITVLYPGERNKITMKNTGTIVSTQNAQVDSSNFTQLNTSCDSAPRNSTTTCRITVPDNLVISSRVQFPRIKIGNTTRIDLYSYSSCDGDGRTFVCEDVYTGVETGTQKIYMTSSRQEAFRSFYGDTKSTVLITEENKPEVTLDQISKLNITCPDQTNINTQISCQIVLPNDKKIPEGRISLGNDSPQNDCALSRKVVNCLTQTSSTGLKTVFFHSKGRRVDTGKKVRVLEYTEFNQDDVSKANVDCGNPIYKVYNSLTCTFTLPENTILPKDSFLDIEGVSRDEDKECRGSRDIKCTFTRNGEETGKKNVSLIYQNGTRIPLNKVVTLTNRLELMVESYKRNSKGDNSFKDSDGDGLSDEFETNRSRTSIVELDGDSKGTAKDENNNGVKDPDEDLDNDGLSNLQEQIFGTDPLKADSENDGLTDYFEILFSKTSPLGVDSDSSGTSKNENNAGVQDSKKDLDSDGKTNLEEQKNGTDPLDRKSR